MMNQLRGFVITAVALLGIFSAQAQLTWDPAADGSTSGGAGTWDNFTANWWNGASDQSWVNSSAAVFGGTGGTVTIGSGSSITVGSLTLNSGAGTYSFSPASDNSGFSVNPGSTWAINNNVLELVGDQVNDFKLTMSSAGTLALTGTGTFDGGEKQNDADWVVAGSTLDVQGAITVYGHTATISQFSTVEMADGSSFSMARNANQSMENNWVLNGDVAFGNRFDARTVWANGVVSGTGRLMVENMGTTANGGAGFFRLNNTANSFSGGITVDATDSETVLQILGDESVLGTDPVSFEADNITLVNGGMIKMDGLTLSENRGITLVGTGGGFVNANNANTINGPITGEGGLIIGRSSDGSANVTTVTSTNNTYTGDSSVVRGTLRVGVDNALPTNTVVVIGGGGGASYLDLNGFDQVIAGLTTAGGNTRVLRNDGAAASTLTINVDTNVANSYTYGANLDGTGDLHIVKEGAGRQEFTRASAYNKAPASITINEGVFGWNSPDAALGTVTVNSGGTLMGSGTFNDVVLNSGSTLSPGYWVGSIKFSGDLDLSAITGDNAGGLYITFNENTIDQIIATNGTVTLGTMALGFSDFDFKDNYGLTNGVYTLIEAAALAGSLDPADLSGAVGDKGATGTLSVSGGSVVLTVEAGDYTPFGQWAIGYGLTGSNADADFDYDGDSYGNFTEYVFGGDPTNSAVTGYVPASGTAEQGGTNWLTISYGYRVNESSLSYDCLTGDDLLATGTWTASGITVLGSGTLDSDFDTVTNAIPMSDAIGFLGVFVEQTE